MNFDRDSREALLWSAGLVAIAGVVAILTVLSPGRNSALTFGSLLVIVVGWFALLALGRVRHSPVAAGAFVAVLIVGMGIGVYGSEWMQMLLFIAYPITFIATSSLAGGIAMAWALTASVAAGLILSGTSVAGVLGYSVSVGVFATAMGVWFHSIWRWGVEREQMREQLADSHKQLVAAAQQQATAAERGRLSREIHDTLAQGYVAIIALAQTPGTRSQIEAVARENLAEARALVNAWRAPALADANLAGALQRLADSKGASFEGAAGEMPVEVETTLLRAAQEALNNARRHADAQRIGIVLGESSSSYLLQVSDDGIGIGDAPEGNGLRGMRERAAILGGSVTIDSLPNMGTTVTVSIPKEVTR